MQHKVLKFAKLYQTITNSGLQPLLALQHPTPQSDGGACTASQFPWPEGTAGNVPTDRLVTISICSFIFDN